MIEHIEELAAELNLHTLANDERLENAEVHILESRAVEGPRRAGAELAESHAVSKNHLMKVAFKLGRAGFLETVRGRNGGLRLARKPEQIGLGEVVRVTEEDFTMVECFDSATNSCAITRACRLRGVRSKALNAYLAVLDEHTLADLTERHPGLSRLLLSA